MTFSREELEGLLSIDRNNLDKELITQPEYLYHTCMGYSYAISKRDRAKDDLRQIERSLPLKILEEAETKLTVKEQEGLVAEHPDFLKAQKQYRKTVSIADKWGALKEAFVARGWALRELAQMDISRQYTTDQVSPRERLAEARQKKSRRNA